MAQEKSLIEQILELWIQLTGLDPDSKTIHFHFGEDFNLDASREDLKEAFRLDDTGLTAMLMLRYMLAMYCQTKTFTLASMLEDQSPAEEQIRLGKKLNKLLQDPELTAEEARFQKTITQVLDRLGCKQDSYKLLKDSMAIGYLRRDAFRSMETLNCYQFAQGKTTSENLRPANNIFLFWDMPAVIRLGLAMPDCTFLGLVKDKMETASFFVLVAKNGENLTVYTDCPEWKHPLQKEMSRRPGRELSARIAKHHFPYDKLGIEYDYRGDAFVKRETGCGLAVIQNKAEVIGKLSDLAPDETLWLILVLAMMDQKLYKQNYHLPELSYCTEVLFENSMLAAPMNQLAVASGKPKFELEHNTTQTLSDDPQWKKTAHKEGDETVFGTVRNYPNKWLEEKYKDQVPEHTINGLLQPPDTTLMLPSKDGQLGDLMPVEQANIEKMGYFDKQKFMSIHTELRTLSGNEFGSLEMLRDNYKFLARYNEASVINHLVQADYKKYMPEMRKWFRERVMGNLQNLIRDMVQTRTPGSPDVKRWLFVRDNGGGDTDYRYRNSFRFHNGNGYTIRETRCIMTGNPVSFLAYLSVSNQADLLYVTGCKSVDELPEWLQHWDGVKVYFGNPILERIDPMTWVIEDPWAKLSFSCTFYLSKTAVNKVCQELEVDPKSLVLDNQDKD